MTTSPATPPDDSTVFAVMLEDADQDASLARIFFSQESAEEYLSRRPENGWVEARTVSDLVPEVVSFMQVSFLLYSYRAGKQKRATLASLPDSPEAIPLLRETYDADALPPYVRDVPLDFDVDDTGVLRVYGTDEDLIRITFLEQARLLIESDL